MTTTSVGSVHVSVGSLSTERRHPKWREILECVQLCEKSYRRGGLPCDEEFLAGNIGGSVSIKIGGNSLRYVPEPFNYKLLCVVEPTLSKEGKRFAKVALATDYILSRSAKLPEEELRFGVPPRTVVLTNADSSEYTIVIRGTNSRHDRMRNKDFFGVQKDIYAPTPIDVHAGFDKAAEFLGILISNHFTNAKSATFRVTGHSLGGVVGALLGAYLMRKGFNVSRVITFGQPMFTNEAGAKTLDATPLGNRLYRIVNEDDPVATIPPQSVHCGLELYMDCDEEFFTYYTLSARTYRPPASLTASLTRRVLRRYVFDPIFKLALTLNDHDISDTHGSYEARLDSLVLLYADSTAKEDVKAFLDVSPFDALFNNGSEEPSTEPVKKYVCDAPQLSNAHSYVFK
mmetsp:Transcript_14958/g.24635  ORF Transcript_14958/g.24635 Transcript_14958/m.24635 type:complete len:401 (-) Transcript_14958:625-1827(-)|eukprot:CAMPEP_0184657924 /NCGR_PEP_ID=MMETSP0308-20130426/22702_1 /TAXON_ID=38269 /ORGANISM="Gloeochaete witrockiana, Strain SAG 46.84" /LENGTH=400 /DNA_ID=CAMNT_0027096377 /DNA_START=256 /DNA_END=1458 /DNA_ORIENTATION=-